MRNSNKILLSVISASLAATPALSIFTSCHKESKVIIVEPSQKEKTKILSAGAWFSEFNFSLTEAININDIAINVISSSIVENESEHIIFTPISVSNKTLTCVCVFRQIPTKNQTINFDIEVQNLTTEQKQTINGLSMTYTYAGEIKSIAVKQMPQRTNYDYSDELDLTGLVVTASYDSGATLDIPYYSVGTITSEPMQGQELLTAEKKMNIKVYVNDKETNFDVEINAIPLTATVNCSVPFCVGDILGKENLFVTANYSDGTTQTVQNWNTDPVIPVGGYEFTETGIHKFDIYHNAYQEPITSISFDVSDKYIYGFDVKCKKDSFKYHDVITKDDFEATITYSDGTSEIIQDYETDVQFPHICNEDDVASKLNIKFIKSGRFCNLSVPVAKRDLKTLNFTFNTEKFGVKSLLNPNDFNVSAKFDDSEEYTPLEYGTGLDQFTLVSPNVDLSSPHEITAEDVTNWSGQPITFKINDKQYSTQTSMPLTTESMESTYTNFNPKTYKAGEYLKVENLNLKAKFTNDETFYKLAYHPNIFTYDGIDKMPYQFTLADARTSPKYIGFHYKQTSVTTVIQGVTVNAPTVEKIDVKTKSNKFCVGNKMTPDDLIVYATLTGGIEKDTLKWNESKLGYKIFLLKDGSEQELTTFGDGFLFENLGEYNFKVKATDSALTTTFQIIAVEEGKTTFRFVPGEESTDPTSWTYESTSRGITLNDIPEEKRKPQFDTSAYTFLGWSRTKNGEVLAMDEKIYDTDIMLYAVYLPKRLDLTYCVNAQIEEETKISIVQSDPQAMLPNLTYSTNGETWYPIGTEETTISAGSRIYLRGLNKEGFSQQDKYNSIRFNGGKVHLSGNIMSILTNGEELEDAKASEFIKPYALAKVFANSNGLCSVSTSFLTVPTTANYLFNETFAGCKNLYNSPNLVDEGYTLSAGCYQGTFKDCSSLMILPNNLMTNGFNATSYPQNCYNGTFENCVMIDSPIPFASDIFAKTVYLNAFSNMYKGCNIQVTKDSNAGNKQILKLGTVTEGAFDNIFSQYGKGITPKSGDTWYVYSNNTIEANPIKTSITPLEIRAQFKYKWHSEHSCTSLSLANFNSGVYDEWKNTAGYVGPGNHFEYKNSRKSDDYRHTFQKIKMNFYVPSRFRKEISLNIKLKTWCYSGGSIFFTPTRNIVSGEMFDYGFNDPSTPNHYVGTASGLKIGKYTKYDNKPNESVFADGFEKKCDWASHTKNKTITIKFVVENESDYPIVISRYFGLSTSVEGCLDVSSEVSGDKEGSSDWWFTIE